MTNPTASSATNLVLFGGNGDLALRMLFPSLYFLDRDGLLPEPVRITAVARSIAEGDDFASTLKESLQEFVPAEHFDEEVWQRFAKRLDAMPLDVTNPDAFAGLSKRLKGRNGGTVFYLAVAPRLYGDICRNLEKAGLTGSDTRVVLEKPIGHDLASSRVINQAVGEVFDEAAIFRVDHYLGKETVQNLLTLRFANFLFEPLWNYHAIEQVQITVAETVGVEGRWSYYDDSGALRDMLQNHMLQLLCLVAMEPPVTLDPDAVRDEKVKVLQSLCPIVGRDVAARTVRGQYTAGAIGGSGVPGYVEESGGSNSNTETFVALRAEISNWRWAGVPFYLRTGKRMPHRYTEIFIQFRDVPHSIFSDKPGAALLPNKLIIRLQPEEQIRLLVMNKEPGLDRNGLRLQQVPLNLSWSETFQKERRRIAYERLLLDALHNNATLFVRRDEVEAAWTWADGILDGWAADGEGPKPYSAGTWGPSASIALPERHGHSWHE